MAELNWIDKNERLPTAEDANEDQLVYAICGGRLMQFNWINVGSDSYKVTHWLPFREIPLPKRWRVPTIQDLAKAGKPIPCRVSNDPKAWWKEGQMLSMISVNPHDETKFWTVAHHGFQFCEICDE